MPKLSTDDGVQLYYEETGSGTPIVFVHEFAGDWRSWEPQVRYFARRYRCITYSARGYLPSDVPENFEVYSQERWRDDMLWLVSGFAPILDVRNFYHHLRERCAADQGRTSLVKSSLRAMRRQALELREVLEYCSPLGPVFRDLRRKSRSGRRRGVGVRSIRRLEDAGVGSTRELLALGEDDLRRLGLRADAARQLAEYARSRQV